MRTSCKRDDVRVAVPQALGVALQAQVESVPQALGRPHQGQIGEEVP